MPSPKIGSPQSPPISIEPRLHAVIEDLVAQRTEELEAANLALGVELNESRWVEDMLRKSNHFFQSIFDAVPDGITVLDPSLTILSLNQSQEAWLPPERATVGRKCFSAYWGRNQPCPDCPAQAALQSRSSQRAQVARDLDDHTQRWFDLRAGPLADKGRIFGLVVVSRDITGQKEMELELLRRARHDPLTGALNRLHFGQQGQSELHRGQRYQRPLSVLMLDLDHFKEVNDTYGHQAGDRVLQALVRACRSQLRAVDLLGRLGGEEFGVVLPETDLATALGVAQRLRRAVAELVVPCELGPVTCTVSIGAAQADPQESAFPRLVARADRALYRAKHRGRNRVEAG